MTDLSAAAVVAHDAGAANLIFAWFAPDAPPSRSYLEGPARAAWRARFGDAPTGPTLEAALDGASFVLTGSGWSSDLEHRARKMAAAAGLPTVGVIDHWVNYPQRFVRCGEQVLPDSIWVVDEYAEALARKTFPGVRVEAKANEYLREQAAVAGPTPEDGRVLWMGEPARDDWGRGKPGEFQALDYFEQHRASLGVPPATPVLLRPHPSEESGKYDSWLMAHPGWSVDSGSDLGEALACARWVVGLESAALVVALASGRTVISALPDWAPRCRLPHADIVHLRDLVVT